VGWWPSLPTDSPLRSCLIDRVVSPEETALYCAGARIVLNPHRDASGCAMASNLWGVPAASPNPRLFEAAACGAFILTDNRRADVGRYFDIGREMDTYSDGTELVAKIKNWLGRDEERFSGARAACEKARKHYTLDVRMRELLETAGAWQCAAGRQAVAV
jgi:spore maturation protein CgeB